ncbi:MAG TPA: hypothetical protein VGN95_25195 [Pyrinomonadaceae bacterium]|jgi:dsRNA-specific ribonuclease|nr:hypothetical protein [Pyrinomonadaceae bacterium]
MGWEQRNGHSYYYSKERDGSRVRSVYVGTGLLAQSATMLTRMERENREAKRAVLHRDVERQNQIDARMDAICDLVDQIITAALIASGFHQHKRQWRLKRSEKENCPDSR